MDIELLDDEVASGSRLTADPYRHAPARITLDPITTSDEIAGLADDWNRLAGDIVFRRQEWLETWWRYFRSSRATLVSPVFRDERQELIGVMPWYLDRSPWQGRVLRLLGSGIVCSDYISLLTAPANTTPLVKQLAHWLDGVFQKEWDAIDLDQVDPNDPALSALVEDLGQRGHNVHQRPGLNCWRIALPESWDAYLASLSRHRRERVRQLWRKSYESKKAVLRQAKTSAELDQAWPILTDLHQRRRRSLGQPGCFASPTFASFLRDASEQLLAVDHTQLTWVEYEGQPAAAGLDFLGDQTLYCYQMGMNPDLMAIEPGNLRMVGRLRSAIESGYQTFDLLRGDEPYKAAWQGQPVPLVRWRIANRRLASRCRHRVWLGNEVAKQCVKDVRDRKRERKLENKPGNQTSHPAAKPESTT